MHGQEPTRSESLPRNRLYLAAAECIAWPFADVGEFRDSQIKCPNARESERFAHRLSTLMYRQSASDLAQRVWQSAETLDHFLIRIAKQKLEPIGSAFRLAPDHDNPGAEILAWRWISLAMPVDLLIAARITDPACSIAHVDVLDPTLRPLEPAAHLHVHATAAFPFSVIWSSLEDEVDLSRVKTHPSGFTDSEWKAWLRRAFIARWILDDWMKAGREHALHSLNRDVALRHAMLDLSGGTCRDINRVQEASLEGFIRKQVYFRRSRSTPRPPIQRENAHLGTALPDPEIHFARRCLSYLLHYPDEHHFRKLWIQRTRIRTILYRHLTHDPAQRGLNAFADRFQRIGEYQSSALENSVASVASRERGIQLETLELRGAPTRLSTLLKAGLQSTSRLTSSAPPSQTCMCWVLHFIRDGKPSDRDAHAIIRRHYQSAYKMIATFEYAPELLRSVRALDVASRELSGPLWYVADPLRRVLDKSRVLAATNRNLEGLRLTIHVGEDFRHLWSGLRSIHEPFWWNLMHRGDRLGHALAIGLDPKQWCEANPVVVMPRHERMLDLVWMIGFVTARKLDNVSSTRIFSAQKELQEHLRSWHVEGASVSDFQELASNLGRPPIWSRINAPNWSHAHLQRSPTLRLLRRLLAESRNSLDLIEVPTHRDWSDLAIVRDELARLLARWRTPIEINPSSNLLIAGFTHALEQPLFHLDSFDTAEARGLVLTLSADDPLCFATTLSDEFAYAWAGMVVGAGLPSAYSQEWLERAAKASRRAAFRT